MASSIALWREISWLHGEIIDRGLSSSLRIIIDYLNLLVAFVFYVVLLVTKRSRFRERRRDWFNIAILGGCALVSIEYYGAAIYSSLISEGEESSRFSWLVSFGRGLIWTTLAISVIVRGPRLVAVLKSAWWIVFFLLISALNILDLVKSGHIQILEVAPWLVNLFLLFCGLKNLRGIVSQPVLGSSFSESLLVKTLEKDRVDLDEASLLSILLFSWINPLLRLGHSRTLNLNDVPSLGSEDEALLAYKNFGDAWSVLKEENGTKNSNRFTFWAIARVYWKSVVTAGICALLRTVSVVATPLFLYAFVNYSNLERKDLKKGVFLVGLLIVLKVVESLSYRQFYFYSRRIGMRMRSALMVAVYRKQLKLSNLGRQRHSTGEIVNYISVDAYRMGESVMWFHVGWASVVQLFLAIAVISSVVGLGVVPGLVPFVICGLMNVPFAKLLQKFQTQFMIAQDKRLRSLSEILNNMKIIKLQSWEEHFKSLVGSFRQNEFKWLSETQYTKTYGTVLYWMSPTIVSSAIFFGCVLFKSALLDAGTVFTVMAALRTMSEPVRFIPEALSCLIQVEVSFERINAFLLEDELKQDDKQKSGAGDSGRVICIQGGCFSWDATDITSSTLRDITLQARLGEKIAVFGPVGAGKSSLLYAILGEIPKISGTVSVIGSVAYVSQGSWIQSGTIRDNILFGKAMDKDKYEEAVRVCALDKDIESFDYGDLTEIGQRGLNLSGGQKQRVQLARAVYDDADIYLLDDPFSAVDAHTAAALFNDCVMTALEKKTVILVTHQVEFLNTVDKILVVEGGQITQCGSYEELLVGGTTFEQLVFAHTSSIGSFDDSYGSNQHEHSVEHTKLIVEDEKHVGKEERDGEIATNPRTQLTEEEEKEVGDVGWKAFSHYIDVSKGLIYACCTFIAQCGFVAFQAAASFWLAFSVQNPEKSSLFVVGIYTLISLLSAVFVYFRSLFAVLLGLKASQSFFSGFTNSIFNAPMLFFDSTPVGRILTRASSDLSVLDFDIPMGFQFVMAAVVEILSTIGIMAYVTWQVLFVGLFAVVSAKYVQGYYQKSAGELMRINGTTKAPVMNYASETALGVATIRAFRVADKFFSNYLKLVDTDAKVFLSSNAALEWLVLRTEALQNLTLFTSAIFLVVFPNNYIAPGLVGLSLSYAFALTGTQVFLSRWYSSLANYIVSVERIKQYMHIPPEPPAIVADTRPSASWPSKGRIELLDLKIRYRPNAPIVLKGITCIFEEGKRVGVVGRTGSGKTTLISALFRLVEPHSGRILVDGLDICCIGLRDLRLKLSIIPQEPTLFRGSVRTNLDPLGLYSDDEIWKALEKCQLKSTISELPNLLESSVSDEGENWSMGQRQLFCLGRVLLKRNKILVLDEATASIDSNTDAILQKIIREEFAECTVITVAHRVPTVIDSDMVLVLSYGKLVEYDEPSKLMEINSSFSNLVAEYWSSCKKIH
ncbi:ABC transporter C family member 8-like [Salvia miltiorrhiza]|uniref:ABC transporter C family member 8-like n=1 Tax=Salvia miltiorrhiza TaxID=226208 RepID=UPI0025AC3882|nr:ABC transporter C family member 8-like [Salvia miltiorrhiza]XP_057772138.1 ABC transporter C family member 8-like [Salvia miltiorrhiza]